MGDDKAIILKIGERYFVKFGNKGQVQTAWSIAGATLFGEWQEDVIGTI